MAMFLNTPLPYKRYKKISETTYFVDKSPILNDIFGCMEEETQYICITRPRRFGKTIMAICWEPSLERSGMLRRYLII